MGLRVCFDVCMYIVNLQAENIAFFEIYLNTKSFPTKNDFQW